MALRCVDASFVVAWLVPDRRSSAVEDAWAAYAEGRDEFIGAPLLHGETVSAIRRLVSRGLLSYEEGVEMVEDFLSLNIATPSLSGLYRQAYDLATRYNQSRAYDACYLALASSLSCQLLTLDARFHKAVAEDFPLVRLVA